MHRIAYSNGPANHRGIRILEGFQKKKKNAKGEDWFIRGIEVMIVSLAGIDGYWIICTWKSNDERFPDDGPYPTAEAAAVSATLQESA